MSGIYYRPAILDRIRRGPRAVIEASAGTGKTFAIEHLFVDLLLSGQCAADQILVVTFTEKATADLRVRIRNALETLVLGRIGGEAPRDHQTVTIGEAEHQRLQDAVRSFDRAAIFTIHGFCHRVLTDFAFQSGSLLELTVTDGRSVFHRVFRDELREHLAADPVAGPLLQEWLTGSSPQLSRGQSADDLEDLLYKAYRRRYLKSPDFGGRDNAIRDLIANFDARFLAQSYAKSGLKGESLRAAADAIDDLRARVAQAQGSAEKLLTLLEDFDFDALVKPILRPGRRKIVPGFPPRAHQIAAIVDKAALAARTPEWRLVDRFLPPVAQRLEREKREQGLIDYDDMLAWVWDALERPGGESLAAALRQRFRCALVDEFQDTDDLQWKIFRRLFVEGTDGNRLYVVGDPKQAIYAFRGADVFTYLAARAELTGNGNDAVPLLYNFRSTGDLIAACNHIFDQNAPIPLFDGLIRYDHPVQCGRTDLKAVDRGSRPITPVVLMRYEKPEGETAAVAEVRRAIGRHIAAQLRHILFDPAGEIKIADKDNKPRRVSARDIYVLTRTRMESAEIGEYLAEAGIPFAFYKQEGLFQTPEAYHILDVLRAVAEPHLRSRRMKAWVTPFFDVPLRELAVMGEVPPAHPLNERLYQWKAAAEREQFAALFDRLLHESGLVNRELLLTGRERRLTNYLHIFEILLAAALARRLDLNEIIALLESYIAGRASPELENGNVQRQESERDAVSVITVHMSKGLEADVVALFGGFGKAGDRETLVVYHENGQRRFAIGKNVKEHFKKVYQLEESEEDQRLLYVGLTRARARLYLPLLPDGLRKRGGGYYDPLNSRLLTIAAQSEDAAARLFEIQTVAPPSDSEPAPDLRQRIAAWLPPPEILNSAEPDQGRIWNWRRRHGAPVTRSYTSLRRLEEQPWSFAAEEFKRDLEPMPDSADLPGGREVGLFLHEALEAVPMDSFAQSPRLDDWRRREDVADVFRTAMRRHQVKEPWFERGTQAVFHALSAPISAAQRVVGPICRCRIVREMEFVYPIPERSHPLLTAAKGAEWSVERGYLKGFVDLVFEHDGLVYFADWKSDQLASYEAAAVEQHVASHYAMQARIYSIGVIRLLQIRTEQDYERRFGGLLYVFLRGLDGGGRQGIHFHRPRWSEVGAYETDLMRMDGATADE